MALFRPGSYGRKKMLLEEISREQKCLQRSRNVNSMVVPNLYCKRFVHVLLFLFQVLSSTLTG